MKKINVLIIIVAILLILVLSIYLLISSSLNKKIIVSPPTITPTSFLPASNAPLPTLNLNQQKQVQADHEWGQWQQKTQETYPWLNKLPLQTPQYYVYFDVNQQKFIADIYIASQESLLKTDIVNRLKAQEIPTDSFPFLWNVR